MRKVKWGVLSTADIARRETIPGMKKQVTVNYMQLQDVL